MHSLAIANGKEYGRHTTASQILQSWHFRQLPFLSFSLKLRRTITLRKSSALLAGMHLLLRESAEATGWH